MADNVNITQGSGTTIAADDIGGILHQRVKIGHGADGSYSDVHSLNPFPTVAGGYSNKLKGSITRPADTNAYAVADAITDSNSAPTVLTIAGFGRQNGGSGVITGMRLISSANQATKPDIDVFVFDTTFTPDNDNAAFTPTDAELETCLGVVRFRGTDVVVGDANSGASGNVLYPNPLNGFSPIAYKCGAGTTGLFFALVARNAYTPVSGEKFTLIADVQQD